MLGNSLEWFDEIHFRDDTIRWHAYVNNDYGVKQLPDPLQLQTNQSVSGLCHLGVRTSGIMFDNFSTF